MNLIPLHFIAWGFAIVGAIGLVLIAFALWNGYVEARKSRQ